MVEQKSRRSLSPEWLRASPVLLAPRLLIYETKKSQAVSDLPLGFAVIWGGGTFLTNRVIKSRK